MATPDSEVKQEKLEMDVADMNIKEEQHDEQGDVNMDTISGAEPVKQERSASTSGSATPKGIKRQHPSPVKDENMAQFPSIKTEVVGGDVELRLDADERPRLVRKQSHKIARRSPELFTDTPDATSLATSTFSILQECVYANKQLGTTEHALECECAEEWGRYQITYQATTRYAHTGEY
jgi:histone-lysine N-methyltransferase SETD2